MVLARKTGEVKYTPKGDKGAKIRPREWAVGVSYLEGKQGQDFYDVVLYNSKLYLCIRSHTSVASETPQQNVASGKVKHWEIATEWVFLATKLLLTEKIKADQIDTTDLTAERVITSVKGRRIIIDPKTNTIEMYNANEKLTLLLEFGNDEMYEDYGMITVTQYYNGLKALENRIWGNGMKTVDYIGLFSTYIYSGTITMLDENNNKSVTMEMDRINKTFNLYSNAWPTSADSVGVGGVYVSGGFLKVK